MYDVLNQDLFPIREAPKRLPNRPHISTVWRWIERGCRGQKLQSWLIGGIRHTSTEAIDDFLRRINSVSTTAPPASTPRSRARAIAEAERELNEQGI